MALRGLQALVLGPPPKAGKGQPALHRGQGEFRQGASIAGWRYDGLQGDPKNYYYRYRGVDRGAHKTAMTGKFRFSPPRIGCLNDRRPRVELRVTWRGTGHAKKEIG